MSIVGLITLELLLNIDWLVYNNSIQPFSPIMFIHEGVTKSIIIVGCPQFVVNCTIPEDP